jgi:hypothetical protein
VKLALHTAGRAKNSSLAIRPGSEEEAVPASSDRSVAAAGIAGAAMIVAVIAADVPIAGAVDAADSIAAAAPDTGKAVLKAARAVIAGTAALRVARN